MPWLQEEKKSLEVALKSATAVKQFTEIVEMVLLDVDQAVGLTGSNTKALDTNTLDAIRALVRKFNKVSVGDAESSRRELLCLQSK